MAMMQLLTYLFNFKNEHFSLGPMGVQPKLGGVVNWRFYFRCKIDVSRDKELK